jgi:hypothetical protein
MWRPQSPAYYSVTKNTSSTTHKIVCCMHCCTVLMTKRYMLSCNRTGNHKNGAGMCVITSVWICNLLKERRPNDPSCAHSTPHTNLTSCNHTLWIHNGFSAHQYLLFWEYMYQPRWKPGFVVKQYKYGVYFCIMQCTQVTVCKIHLFHNLCCSSSFVAMRAEDTDTAVCCTSRTNYFLGDVTNLASISSFSSVCVFCMFSSWLELNQLLKTCSPICTLFLCWNMCIRKLSVSIYDVSCRIGISHVHHTEAHNVATADQMMTCLQSLVLTLQLKANQIHDYTYPTSARDWV